METVDDDTLLGIKKLCVAVIERALLDVKDDGGRGRDAEEWFNERSRKPFGYFWCLEHSGINPNRIVKYLKEINKYHI